MTFPNRFFVLGFTLIAVLLLSSGEAQAVTAYPYGTLPTGAADADLTSAYNLWKTRRYVSASCGYRVDNGGGGTYSEGMGYGMLMAAYIESNDTMLANLYQFYSANFDSRGLMNWSVGSGSCANNNANAATDGDLDAALALVKAAKRWPASSNNWGAKATTLLNNIHTYMVSGALKNGDTWGGSTDNSNKAYNPSYFRTGYLKSFDCFEGGTRWASVRSTCYTVLGPSLNTYALPPDWVYNNGNYGTATNSGGYGYDSCRTPWAVGMDYLWWGNTTAQSLDNRITASMAAQGAASTIGDDYNYSTGGRVSANHEPEFIGAIGVASMCGTNSSYRDAVYVELAKTDKNTYFADSLRVVYLMAMTGNFQEPCAGSVSPGSPTASPTRTASPTITPTPTPAFSLVKSASLATAAIGQTFTYYLSYANRSTGPDSSGVTSGVSLQFNDNAGASPQSTVNTNFQITNNSGGAIDLANYRVRYFYYETSNATPASYSWGSYYDQSGKGSGSFYAFGPYVGPPSANLELRVTWASYAVASGAGVVMQGAYTYSGNPSLTLSDDWSWPGAVGSYTTAAAANIVLEQNVAGTWKPVCGAYPGGAAAISNVTVTDSFDSRISFVSSVPAGTYGGGALTVNFASLAPAQSGNVTITAYVNATAGAGNVIPNSASIGASGFATVTSNVANITASIANTPTRTATLTVTLTATGTATPSATPTLTSSPASTATATPSATGSRSPSPTGTPSSSPGATASATPTVSLTRSHSPSATTTSTASPSATPTATSSATSSATLSSSPSATPTRTVTATATRTATVSPSLSASPTSTDYAGSPTNTSTVTATPTATATASVTLSVSPSPTGTVTPSRSATSTASPTATPSSTPRPSASASPSLSVTPTASPSPTLTLTGSPGPSRTVSPTASVTLVPSGTATLQATLVPTTDPTVVPTSVPTLDPTVVPTAPTQPGAGGPLRIGRHVPVPDPWTGAGPATLKLQLDGDADHVTVRVYTQAMVLVAEARLEGAQAGWVTVTLPPDQAARLRGGAYYYWADADRQGAHCAKVKGVWMVLR